MPIEVRVVGLAASDPLTWALPLSKLRAMFRDFGEIENYFVYSYEHLDDLSFLRSPKDVLPAQVVAGTVDEWLERVGNLLRQHGWEGDGDIEIMWFPPFVSIGVEDTHGTYVWLVKQDNNGTAFVASSVELPFNRLLAQNKNRAVWQGRLPVGLVRPGRTSLIEWLKRISVDLDADLRAVDSIGTRAAGIRTTILERAQGQLVQALNGLLDDVYLQLLIHVIQDGNRSKVKLRKGSVMVNTADYLPEEGEDVDGFFTLGGLVSDMWRAYKFEPFRERLKMLVDAVEFSVGAAERDTLLRHVALRNSVQHHEGKLDPTELKRLGKSSLELMGPGSTLLEIRAWGAIAFSIEELKRFEAVLRDFAASLDHHVEARLSARFYVTPAEANEVERGGTTTA